MLRVLMFQRLFLLMTMSWVLESSKSTQRKQISTDLTHRSINFMYHFNKGSHEKIHKCAESLRYFKTALHLHSHISHEVALSSPPLYLSLQ